MRPPSDRLVRTTGAPANPAPGPLRVCPGAGRPAIAPPRGRPAVVAPWGPRRRPRPPRTRRPLSGRSGACHGGRPSGAAGRAAPSRPVPPARRSAPLTPHASAAARRSTPCRTTGRGPPPAVHDHTARPADPGRAGSGTARAPDHADPGTARRHPYRAGQRGGPRRPVPCRHRHRARHTAFARRSRSRSRPFPAVPVTLGRPHRARPHRARRPARVGTGRPSSRPCRSRQGPGPPGRRRRPQSCQAPKSSSSRWRGS